MSLHADQPTNKTHYRGFLRVGSKPNGSGGSEPLVQVSCEKCSVRYVVSGKAIKTCPRHLCPTCNGRKRGLANKRTP